MPSKDKLNVLSKSYDDKAKEFKKLAEHVDEPKITITTSDMIDKTIYENDKLSFLKPDNNTSSGDSSETNEQTNITVSSNDDNNVNDTSKKIII